MKVGVGQMPAGAAAERRGEAVLPPACLPPTPRPALVPLATPHASLLGGGARRVRGRMTSAIQQDGAHTELRGRMHG